MTTTPPEELPPAVLAAFWVDQVAAAMAQQTAQTTVAASAWQSFVGWYSPAAIAGIAQEMAATSLAAQEIVAGLITEYVAQVAAVVRGDQRIIVPPIHIPVIRNGVDLEQVHSRPARAYRVEYAKDQDVETSIQAAFDREVELLEADLMLAAREAELEAMRELDVTHYRRVLRPELSKTGSCLLCVAASIKVYTISDLLPIHIRCKCRTMPIIDGEDPAEQLNEQDRKRVYAEAGVQNRSGLSNLRVKVNEHGELGPVLTVKGHRFTGEDDLKGKGSGADRAAVGATGGEGGGEQAAGPATPAGRPERPLLGDFITDTRDPGPEHERSAREAWQSVMDREFGSADLRAEVDFVMFQPDNVHFSGTIRKPSGDSVGMYDRIIHREPGGILWAEHSYLKIDDADLQGTGFADEFNETLYGWYRESGFQRVELDANIDIGGYAWARAGYDFADEDGARRALQRLENEPVGGGENGAAVRDVLERAARYPFGHALFPTAFEVSQAGRGSQHLGKQATWPGKRAMIGFFKNWRGVKWL